MKTTIKKFQRILVAIILCFALTSKAQNCVTSFSYSVTNGNQVTFSNTSSNSTFGQYAWDFGDGYYGNAQNPTHTYSQNGNFTVCLYDSLCSSFACDTTISITNACSPPQIAITTIDASSSLNCDGSVIISISGGVSPYTLVDPNNVLVSLSGSVWSNTAMCTGFYGLTVTDNIGCQTQGGYQIKTNPCDAAFTYNDSGCTNGITYFVPALYKLSQVGASTTFSWDFGDGNVYTSYTGPEGHTYAAPGTYTVCLTVTDSANNCSVSHCESVIVNCSSSGSSCSIQLYSSLDSSNLSSNSYLFYPYVSWNGSVSYFWSFGDGNTSNQQYPSHTYANVGTYQVCLTILTSDSCSSTTCTTIFSAQSITVINTQGLAGIRSVQSSISNTFPNPANESVTINLKDVSKQQISILDMLGNEIIVKETQGLNSVTINTESIPNGIYLIKVDNELGTAKRLIISH